MPSHHSGSSHSSSSHSSSSSSRSGSSRSSSHSSSSHSSSWGSSSRSSWGNSSRSSGSSSGGGLFGGLFVNQETNSRRSSRHSETSRSAPTVYRSSYVRDGSMRGSVIERSRSNQPRGYVAREHHDVEPIPHYGLFHNYYYYPLSWTDEATGQHYEKGYYDEDGKYYENVAFRRTDGVYQNVVCQCEYCDTVSKIDWTEGGPLICPQCGGTMKLLSALDEYTQDPLYQKTRKTPGYVDYADAGKKQRRRTLLRTILWIGLIVLVILGVSVMIHWTSNRTPQYNYTQPPAQAPSNVELFGNRVGLVRTAPGVYQISTDREYDRIMSWEPREDSYYEPESDLYLWYNTDVEPPLWQYWYEPISGGYGDYGWMEYENGSWYIEASYGKWIEVPAKYDTSPLWRIEDQEGIVVTPEDEDREEDLHTIPTHGADSPEDLKNPQRFNEIIYLERSGEGSYVITGNVGHDLEPVWQEAEQSYYEPSSGMWLWYNTGTEPNFWQYWYEPISADYTDSGWMKYENGSWYIEASYGDWIEVLPQYDTSLLWHIESD